MIEKHPEIKKGLNLVKQENSKNIRVGSSNINNKKEEEQMEKVAKVKEGCPITPSSHRLFVKSLENPKDKSKGELILPDNLKQEQLPYFEVIAVGPEVRGNYNIGDIVFVASELRFYDLPILKYVVGEVFENSIIGKINSKKLF